MERRYIYETVTVGRYGRGRRRFERVFGQIWPSVLLFLLVLVISSPTVGGMLFRGTLVAPLYWLGVIEMETARAVAFGLHW